MPASPASTRLTIHVICVMRAVSAPSTMGEHDSAARSVAERLANESAPQRYASRSNTSISIGPIQAFVIGFPDNDRFE